VLRSTKEIFGFNLLAEDGEIGSVQDIYFSDDAWTVRYLVVDTGPWIFGRKVLISVPALGLPDWEQRVFPVSLTREQVKNSPDIDTDKPVSRQQEIELHDYYRLNGYWTAQPGFTSEVKLPGPIYTPGQAVTETVRPREQGDPHLRSAKTVIGYHLKGSDGTAGQLEDFLLDDATWFLHYAVINTGTLLNNKKVLIAPLWLEAIRDDQHEVFLDVEQAKIQGLPEYDPTTMLAREYQELLDGHYDRSKFWHQSS
jgi:hypothetical protein